MPDLKLVVRCLALTGAALLTTSCFHKKYDNPITKDTRQPDKALFDSAIKDLERNRYEVARLTLNTLISTYDQSEYLAKAKLALADSWYREGGTHGLSQAEAEYKDFKLLFPTLGEAAEAQQKVCMIQYKQMEKADRDLSHAVRAEDECRQVLLEFPNSKFAPQAQQILRNIQEVIAESEYRVGSYYHLRGANPAAANRLGSLVDQYPLYSKADESLWMLGDSYSKMANVTKGEFSRSFRERAGKAYQQIVRDYPLSDYVDPAKKELKRLELPIPSPDPVAYNRMKYEIENRTRHSLLSNVKGIVSRGPNVDDAAKAGTPPMTAPRPTVPLNVPGALSLNSAETAGGGQPAAGNTNSFSGDVSVSTVGANSALDTKPDARAGSAPASVAQTTDVAAPAAASSSASDKKKAKKKRFGIF